MLYKTIKFVMENVTCVAASSILYNVTISSLQQRKYVRKQMGGESININHHIIFTFYFIHLLSFLFRKGGG